MVPLLSVLVARSGAISDRGGYRPWRKAVAVLDRMPWLGALA